jgi:hypothetical protein
MAPICAFREKHSGKTNLSARQREYILKQRRCRDALKEYFTEARKTMALMKQCLKEPRNIAAYLQVIAQRDREAEAQRHYLQTRKLLLQAAKVSCLPNKRNGRSLLF